MAGILSPCCSDIVDISAPVAAKSIFPILPSSIIGRKSPHSTLALHPQPEPPQWVSCLSLSKMSSPQSRCCLVISTPCF